MGRKKIYHTEEERKAAACEAVKRNYRKNHPPKEKKSTYSAYSPEYHHERYLRKKAMIKDIKNMIWIHKDYCTYPTENVCTCCD